MTAFLEWLSLLAWRLKLLLNYPPKKAARNEKRSQPASDAGGMRIAISSGHGLHVRGASGFIDEVDEARRVTDRVADMLRGKGHTVHVFHEDAARTQADNVSGIVRWHNSQERDRDCSVHFNAVDGRTANPIGTEVVVHPAADARTRTWASKVARAIAAAGNLRLRRPGEFPGVLDLDVGFTRDIRGFIEGCGKGSVLLEVCFVNSEADSRLYSDNFDKICVAIADALVA